MKTIILSCVLLFLSTVYANQDAYQDQLESESRSDKDDVAAYESFNSPVYGGLKSGVSGKGYPALPPPAPAGYLNNLMPYGYGNAYGMMPYAAAPYYGGYGAPYAAGYGYGAPGYGYPAAGLPYGNGLFGRSAAYNGYAYGGYPGYAGGLGYRFGGLNAAYRGAPVVPAVPGAPLPPPAAYAGPVPALPVAGKGAGLQYGYAPGAAQKLPVY